MPVFILQHEVVTHLLRRTPLAFCDGLDALIRRRLVIAPILQEIGLGPRVERQARPLIFIGIMIGQDGGADCRVAQGTIAVCVGHLRERRVAGKAAEGIGRLKAEQHSHTASEDARLHSDPFLVGILDDIENFTPGIRPLVVLQQREYDFDSRSLRQSLEELDFADVVAEIVAAGTHGNNLEYPVAGFAHRLAYGDEFILLRVGARNELA